MDPVDDAGLAEAIGRWGLTDVELVADTRTSVVRRARRLDGSQVGLKILKPYGADEINGARDVTKSNTYRVETFRSGEMGFLGYVDDDKVSFYNASTRRHTGSQMSGWNSDGASRSCRICCRRLTMAASPSALIRSTPTKPLPSIVR